MEVDPSKEEVVKHQQVIEIHLEVDKGELLDDYEPTLFHVEDSKSDYEKSSHEKAQNTIDIPCECHNLMEVGFLLAPQEDEPADLLTQVQVKDPTLALEEE